MTPTVPCRDPSGSKWLEWVCVAQQFLLLHLVQDVLAEYACEAELAIAHQREHQVHQLFQDVFRQLHQAAEMILENDLSFCNEANKKAEERRVDVVAGDEMCVFMATKCQSKGDL